jgi:transposase-like protein
MDKPGPGRPSLAHVPEIRELRIRAIGQIMAGDLSPKRAARAYGVHKRTLYRWRSELLGDGEADTEALRRLLE